MTKPKTRYVAFQLDAAYTDPDSPEWKEFYGAIVSGVVGFIDKTLSDKDIQKDAFEALEMMLSVNGLTPVEWMHHNTFTIDEANSWELGMIDELVSDAPGTFFIDSYINEYEERAVN